MRLTRYDAASVALLGLVAVVGVVLLPSLPDRFAIHFGTGGADSFVSPFVGVLLLPAIGVAVVALIRVVGNVRLVGGGLQTSDVPAWYGLALAAFLAYVQGVVLAWNLGSEVSVAATVLPAAAVFVLVSVAVGRR